MANIKQPHRTNGQKANKNSILIIPCDQLAPDTLRAVVEEFVTRNGTDYGEIEVSLEQKVHQVYKELESGRAIILFDTKEQICNIFKKDDPAVKDVWGRINE